MIAHSLASEAVLRTLARRFGEDEEMWGIAGLLHDIDVEITNGDSMRSVPSKLNWGFDSIDLLCE
ncbi:MAG: HD domain-containing protein [Bacteroidales bacterium]